MAKGSAPAVSRGCYCSNSPGNRGGYVLRLACCEVQQNDACAGRGQNSIAVKKVNVVAFLAVQRQQCLHVHSIGWQPVALIFLHTGGATARQSLSDERSAK